MNGDETGSGDAKEVDVSGDNLDGSTLAEDPKYEGHLQRKQEYDAEGKKSSNRFGFGLGANSLRRDRIQGLK